MIAGVKKLVHNFSNDILMKVNITEPGRIGTWFLDFQFHAVIHNITRKFMLSTPGNF